MLRGSLNVNKLVVYKDAKVKAKYIINKGLTKDDKMLREQYETTKQFQEELLAKYSKADLLTAKMYIGRIQNFKYKESKGINYAQAKLKEYRHKAITVNLKFKTSYNNEYLLF